jgi:hypothetical protein
MIRWCKNKDRALRGDYDDEDTWDVSDPESMFMLWLLMDALEWKHLPDEGGLLDQDESIMNDLSTMTFVSQKVKSMLDDEKQDTGTGARL